MDEANFDRNLSGFIQSVLYAACSEMEADSSSDRHSKTGNTDTITIEPNKEREETACEEERTAVFRDFRSKELNRLTGTAPLNRKSGEAGDQYHGETDTLETEETASEEERFAFFQDVRDSERKKFVEAFERDKRWKEEREQRRIKRRQEKIKKQFEEFHTPAVGILLSSYSSPEHEPNPYNEYCHQVDKARRSKSATTDYSTKQVDSGEMKIDLTLLGENKEKGRKEEDYQDMARTSNSELYTSGDIGDPSRPELKPILTQLEERHETTRAHLSGSTNQKSAESVNPLPLDLTRKSSFESVRKLSTDEYEPTKSVQIEIPDSKFCDSTIEYSLKSAGIFQRFRKWFKRLCCCCNQNAEDNE